MSHACPGGCGRQVSENKIRCRACIEEAAAATVTAKNEELMDEATHILMKFDSQNREDLYRADGMLLASRQGEMVRFGTEPKEAGNRLFLSSAHAAKWIRKLASLDLAKLISTVSSTEGRRLTLAEVADVDCEPLAPAVIDERDAEHTILMPSGAPVQVLRN